MQHANTVTRVVNLRWALGLFLGPNAISRMGHVSLLETLLETLLEIRVKQRGNPISKFSNVESSAVDGIRSTLAAQQEAQCLYFQGRGCLGILLSITLCTALGDMVKPFKLRSASETPENHN